MKKISKKILKMKRLVYYGVAPFDDLKRFRNRLKEDEVLVCIVPAQKETPKELVDTIAELKHRCMVYEIGGIRTKVVLRARAVRYTEIFTNAHLLPLKVQQ